MTTEALSISSLSRSKSDYHVHFEEFKVAFLLFSNKYKVSVIIIYILHSLPAILETVIFFVSVSKSQKDHIQSTKDTQHIKRHNSHM